MTATEPLKCGPISEGASCWLLRFSDPHIPIHCPGAIIVRGPDGPEILHDGSLWDKHEVFVTEEHARVRALEGAKRDLEWYRERIDRMQRIILELQPTAETKA